MSVLSRFLRILPKIGSDAEQRRMELPGTASGRRMHSGRFPLHPHAAPCQLMAQQPITIVGNDNITGSHLSNVGNKYITYVTESKQDRGNFLFPVHLTSLCSTSAGKLLTLESCVAFDALLNAKERYPAPRCHPDTRQAAQDVVTNWIRRRGVWAHKGIMWISGAPGVGKSAILQTVCEALGGDDVSKSWLIRVGIRHRYAIWLGVCMAC